MPALTHSSFSVLVHFHGREASSYTSKTDFSHFDWWDIWPPKALNPWSLTIFPAEKF